MQKTIVRDTFFLAQVSSPASQADLGLARDLEDTLEANKDKCVGLAANMIGVQKRAIIINMGLANLVMFNPVLLSKNQPYQTEEGCLSIVGTRPTTRYEQIEVEFYDKNWTKQKLSLTGFPAQICQHELDHLEGIII